MLTRLGLTRREARALALIVLAGFALRLAFALVTHGHQLIGDEVEYNNEGRFIEQGKWFWTYAPTGVAHEGLWKTPIYPAFVGILYEVLGPHYDRVLLVQTLIGPVTITLAWLLARRLFDTRVAFVAATIVALCPFAWQFEVRMLAESIVAPMTLVFMIVLLEREPTMRRAALAGAVCGVVILTRPSALYLLPVLAGAFVVAAGLRRGAVLTVAAVAVTALVISPWTIRNYVVSDEFVPLSIQDVAPYGTFNDDSANDPENPYAWRIHNSRDDPILARARRIGELELRRRLRANTAEYIRENPASLIKAFYWNGLTRLWDIRRPSHHLDEAAFSGRPRWFAALGLATWWLALPFALYALWLLRRRRTILVPVLLLALSATLVFTAEGATRYRAPLDPFIAVIAAFGVVTAFDAVRRSRLKTD